MKMLSKWKQTDVWKISHYHEISVSSMNLDYFSYSLGVICMSDENCLIAQRIIFHATYMLHRGASYPLLICSNL